DEYAFEPMSLSEIQQIYWPLSHLLHLYVANKHNLYQSIRQLLKHQAAQTPYLIGITGSVAVGKSTAAKVLQKLLVSWPEHPKVEVVSTDSFLYPQAVLIKHNLAQRKGFPESYNQRAWIKFLKQLKSGQPLTISQYSHELYDIVPNSQRKIQQPDIVII